MNFQFGRKVFPFWQEVANNLGGAMTGGDHPDNTQTDCVWLFYTAFSTSGLSTSPIYSKGARVKCSLLLVMESGITKTLTEKWVELKLNQYFLHFP